MALGSPKTIFWEVDVQADFSLPGGSLYIPDAEKIMANINLLVDAARQGRVFLISSADAHNRDDPELHDWPPHCLTGTPGADLLPEACASPRLVIPNQESFTLPKDLGAIGRSHSRKTRSTCSTIQIRTRSWHDSTPRLHPPSNQASDSLSSVWQQNTASVV